MELSHSKMLDLGGKKNTDAVFLWLRFLKTQNLDSTTQLCIEEYKKEGGKKPLLLQGGVASLLLIGFQTDIIKKKPCLIHKK